MTYLLLRGQVETELPDEVLLFGCQRLRLWIANNDLQNANIITSGLLSPRFLDVLCHIFAEAEFFE